MNSTIDYLVENDKARYLNYLRDTAYKKVFIYGAGKTAKPLYKFLEQNGISIDGFCVTDKSINSDEEIGKKVYSLAEIDSDIDDTVFLLGINPRLNEEVEQIIRQKGFYKILRSTRYIRYYDDNQLEFYTHPMMEISVKMGCPINCKFCPQAVLLKKYYENSNIQVMDINLYKSCIDELPERVHIMFAGFTEPCLHENWIEMLEYAIEKKHKVSFYTTLVGMTKYDFEKIKKKTFEDFVIHVPDKMEYASIPITDEYLSLLEDVVTTKRENGENFVSYASSQAEVPEKIKGILKNRVRIFTSLSDRAGNLKDEDLFSGQDFKGCITCEASQFPNHNVLLPDGRVVLCSQDFGMKHILGNLYTQSYEEILEGEEIKSILEERKKEYGDVLCRKCYLAQKVD